MRFSQFSWLEALIATDLNADIGFVTTTDLITLFPMEYMLGTYYVIGRFLDRSIKHQEDFTPFATIAKNYLNTGIDLAVQLTFLDKVKLLQTPDIRKKIICLKGKVEKVKGRTYRDPNNLALIDTKFVTIYDHDTLRKKFEHDTADLHIDAPLTILHPRRIFDDSPQRFLVII